MIKLPKKIHKEFVARLKDGEAEVEKVGRFYLTKFTKISHPTPQGVTSIDLKNFTVKRINFKPHKDLKREL